MLSENTATQFRITITAHHNKADGPARTGRAVLFAWLPAKAAIQSVLTVTTADIPVMGFTCPTDCHISGGDGCVPGHESQ